jgi:DNA processing protein
MQNPDDLKYKIGITLIPLVGDVNAKKLIAYCGGAEAVFKEKKKDLLNIPGIGNQTVQAILSQNIMKRAEQEVAFVEKNNIKALFFADKEYPERLKHCVDSPVVLFVKGNAEVNVPKVLAVVGTRKASPWGKDITKKIIEELAGVNIVIVSGLAYGIDIAAHKASLDCGIPTIGVLGHGLDRMYPASHKPTADAMLENGALVCDYLSDTPFNPENFPKRNRIIAGLADAVLVVEAAAGGGALITAELANGYNRDVFAVPNKPGEKYSAGCNKLIKTNKAAMVESAADIVYFMRWEEEKRKTKNIQKKLFVELADEERAVIDLLNGNGTLSLDMIGIQLEMLPSKTASVLLNLEFMGLLKSLPGKMYQLC